MHRACCGDRITKPTGTTFVPAFEDHSVRSLYSTTNPTDCYSCLQTCVQAWAGLNTLSGGALDMHQGGICSID